MSPTTRRRMSLLCLSLVPAIVIAAPTTLAHHGNGTNRYVAVNGSDDSDCTDASRPCRTIAHAIDRAGKGDRVLVAGGTYRLDPDESASLLNPIIEVSGGYSVQDGFARADVGSNPTYILGPDATYRPELAKQGLTLVQDAKALAIAQVGPEALTFMSPPPGLTTRYVDDGGVDAGECLSPDAACATIAYARSRAAIGDQILVAGGTYQIDPAEMPILLDDALPIRGGYSLEQEFAVRAPEAEPSYLIGPPFQQRARLAARGFTLIQDAKGLSIEAGMAAVRARGVASLDVATSCTDGAAGPYPCHGIDFLAQIPLNQFSSNPGAANDIWGFVDLNDNREYALIGLRNGTAVVDVTDPENPVEVGTVPGNPSIWRDIKVLQTFDETASEWQAYAYVTVDATAQGLQIIDLTDLPGSVTLAATYQGFASAHNVYLANVDYASGAPLPGRQPFVYILGSDIDGGAFRILDVSDPVAPVEVTAPPSGTGYVHDAASLLIHDARAAACRPGHQPCEVLVDYNETTVDLWDVTDKAAPFLISSTPYPGAAYTHSGWATEDQMYVFVQDELDEQNQGVNTTLRTLDISDLSAPFISGTWIGPTASIDHNGFVKGQRYYMSNYRRGLTVLDISDPNAAQEIGFFDTFPDPADNGARFDGAWGTYPFLPSGTVLVSDIQGGLFLLREQPLPPVPPVVSARMGYAWADRPTSSGYEVNATYAFNSGGGPITVTREGTGRYAVRFGGLGGNGQAGGHVQATSFGPASDRCNVDGWNSGGADFVARISCFDSSGAAADALYTILVSWPEVSVQ